MYGTVLAEIEAPKRQIALLKPIFLFSFPWRLDIKRIPFGSQK